MSFADVKKEETLGQTAFVCRCYSFEFVTVSMRFCQSLSEMFQYGPVPRISLITSCYS